MRRESGRGGNGVTLVAFALCLVLAVAPLLVCAFPASAFKPFKEPTENSFSAAPALHDGLEGTKGSQPSPENRSDGGSRTWTLALYMSADNNLEPFATADLDELAGADVPSWLGVAVLVDGSSSGDSVLYTVEGTALVQVDSFASGELDMSEAETMAMFLNWTSDNLPAGNLCFAPWGHGSGWRGMLSDKGSVMTLPSFGDALGWGLGGERAEILMLDMCSMALAETACEAAPYADLLLASEMEIPEFGMSYDVFVETVRANPDITPTELGRTLCDAYLSTALEISQYSVTISLVDLAPYRSGMTSLITDFSDAMVRWMPGAGYGIQSARDLAESYQKGDAYDLGDLLTNVATDDSLVFMRKEASALLEAYKSSVLHHLSYDHPDPNDGCHALRSSGLVIQFYWGSIPDDYRPLKMSEATIWDEATDSASLPDSEASIAVVNATYSGGARVTVESWNATGPANITLYLENGAVLASLHACDLTGLDIFVLGVPRPAWAVAVASVSSGGRTQLVGASARFWAWGSVDDIVITGLAVRRGDGQPLDGKRTAIAGEETTVEFTVGTMTNDADVSVNLSRNGTLLSSTTVQATPAGCFTVVTLVLDAGHFNGTLEFSADPMFPNYIVPDTEHISFFVSPAEPSSPFALVIAFENWNPLAWNSYAVRNERSGEVLAEGRTFAGELTVSIPPEDYLEGDALVVESGGSKATVRAYSSDGGAEVSLDTSSALCNIACAFVMLATFAVPLAVAGAVVAIALLVLRGRRRTGRRPGEAHDSDNL